MLDDMTFDVPTAINYPDIPVLDHVCSLDCAVC